MFNGTLKPYQVDAVDKMVEYKTMLVAYEMGLGKEQPVSEPVLTPTGWVPIGSLKAGDFVVGKDGQPTRVLGVFPQGVKDVYQVVFNDESSTRCGLEHLWTVQTSNDFTRNTSRTMTVRELLESGLRQNTNNNRKYRIPMVDPVEFACQSLPLDPYLLGSLLGDGYLPKRSVRFSTADTDYIEELKTRLPPNTFIKQVSKYDYVILGTEHHQNPVLFSLRDLGLTEKNSHTKFIPEIYKRASVSERIELLAGLLDTDGHFSSDGNIEYISASETLVRDVQEIVRSLGGTCKIREKKIAEYGVYFRSNIKVPPSITPTILRRKRLAYKPKTKYPPTRLIDSISLVGQEESVCIRVAAPDQLYVTKDYIVTHNTVMTISAMEKLRETNSGTVLILCLASLKYQWQKEITKFSDATSLVVDGTPKQRKAYYESYQEYDYIIMNYEQVVNDWDIVRGKTFCAVICDEATAIKGFRAKRAKKVKELSRTIPIRFALTGTPIENGRPEEIYSIMQFVNKDVLGRFDVFDKTFIVRNHFGGVQRYRNLPILHDTLSEYTVRKSQKDDDVAPYLPDAVYREPLLIPLDSKSQSLYNYISEDLIELLHEAQQLFGSSFDVAAHYGQWTDPNDPANSYRGDIMARITAMRQLCSNPDLLLESHRNFAEQNGSGSGYVWMLGEDGWLEGFAKYPKLDAAVAYLSDHLNIDETYKAVLFSSYLGSVRALVDRLNAKGFPAYAYTGKMNAKEKEAAKVQFQTDPKARVLVSSDAGGYGVDLPQANLLVNYDQPWTSGLSVQRNGRINRTSSTWPTITIQDILVKNSIEERQYNMLTQKNAVASAVLDGQGINARGGIDFTIGSLLNFLTTKAL